MIVSKEFKVQVPTDVVRNPEIPCNVFVLYAKLIQLYYATYQKEEFKADHKALMYHLNIGDNRTFKKSYNTLYEFNLVKNKLDSLPRKNGITVQMNVEKLPNKDNGIMFTQLTKNLLELITIKKIGDIGVRIIYYIQSRINNTKRANHGFCFASQETIAEEIGVDRKTVIKKIEELRKVKFIKVDKHELEDTGQYIRKGESEILFFTKYNNHYFVREDKIDEFRLKYLENMLKAE
ncbi:helix-turn-helix domain-containing protein [Schinkia azotoformans]|uniref:helix-turn-helix domain-containing protein n=1 Tax=Schinkia azotoformans TaxID=1454 RepID=UPI002DBFE3BB|nr:helix-turn-helix domain-containing protein [Schinkia azotoformans]MEC1757395.1 helix-turn-helix domain-containing protein [Schinkia azotoformans]